MIEVADPLGLVLAQRDARPDGLDEPDEEQPGPLRRDDALVERHPVAGRVEDRRVEERERRRRYRSRARAGPRARLDPSANRIEVALEPLDARLHHDVAVADPVVELGGDGRMRAQQRVVRLGQPAVLRAADAEPQRSAS